VNGRDVQLQVEQTTHDVHALAEVELADEATVEYEYRGGVEVLSPREDVRVGDAPQSLRILDFRREGRDYVVLVEGRAGAMYDVVLRTDLALRGVQNASPAAGRDGFPRLRVEIPAGPAQYARREIRFRT
jgi:hypothetical protein